MVSMVLLRGNSGSGKTTYAQNMLPDKILVEADQFRVNKKTGEYKYQKSDNAKVHKLCYEHVKDLLQNGHDVVVANIFNQRWQMRQYYQLAAELNVIDIMTIELKADYGRNGHGVDQETKDRYQWEWQSGYGDVVDIEGVVTIIRRLTPKNIVFGLRLHSTDYIEDLGDDDVNNRIGVAKVYVSAVRDQLKILPRIGDCWQVNGTLKFDPFIENKLEARNCIRCLPTAKALLNCIIEDKERFAGIGERSLLRVWRKCLPDLQTVLDSGDSDGQLTDPLIGNLTMTKATQLLDGWNEHRSELDIMKWLQSKGVPLNITTKVYKFWNAEAIEKLQENPYRLLAFFDWRLVDDFALSFGISEDDPLRYAAAIEATCYQQYEKGSTAISCADLNAGIQNLLGSGAPCFKTREAIWKDWLCYFIEDELVQLAGIYAQETFVERSIERRLNDLSIIESSRQNVLFNINKLAEYEVCKTQELREVGVLGMHECFQLNDGQINAIPFLLKHRVCCLTGGAGTGKTAILEAIVDQLPHDATLIQLAPTGRAARVLNQATGRAAMTIARFVLQAYRFAKISDAWVFVDEASMVSLTDAHRLLEVLSDSVRLIFIGDNAQLPPVGAGLIFHRMLDPLSMVPHIALSEVIRAAAETGIPQLSLEIRQGINPSSEHLLLLRSIQEQQAREQAMGCAFFIKLDRQSTQDTVLDEYWRIKDQAGEFPQILAASNYMCHDINTTLQAEHKQEREYYNQPTPIIQVKAPRVLGQSQTLTIGDRVLWHTKNDSKRDLSNGDLGIVRAIYPDRKVIVGDGGKMSYVCIDVEFENKVLGLTESDLNYLALGYAITGHKGQGSGWNHVVIVIEKNTWLGSNVIEIIDRSWIYTAVTRAKRQVSIIGDYELFVDAVLAPPLSDRRLCGFHCREKSRQQVKLNEY